MRCLVASEYRFHLLCCVKVLISIILRLDARINRLNLSRARASPAPQIGLETPLLEYALLAAAISAAQPQATASASVEAAPATTEANVTRYAPTFFAQSRPSTAYDMVQRLPGFTVTNGEEARGLSGTAGNVLVNGERPSSKSDSIADVLQRIPAEEVTRIDLIRGGAPGIDMQGRPVVANVIATQSQALSGSATIGADHVLTTDRRSGTIDVVGAYKVTAHQTLRGQLSYDNAFGPGGMGGMGGVSNQTVSNRIRLDPTGTSLLSSGTTSRGTGSGLTGLAGYDFKVLGGDGSASLQMFKSKVEGADTEIFRTSSPTRFATNQGERKGGELDANYTHPLFAGSTLVLTGLKSWRDNVSNTSSVTGSTVSGIAREESSGETVGRAALNWRPIASLSTVTSAEAAYNVLDGSSALNLAGVLTPVPGSAAKVEEHRGEISSVATWQARPKMVIEGGLRYEFSKLSARGLDKSLQFLKPSLQASFRLSPTRQLRFRVERTVGQLDFGDYLSTASLGTGVITAGAADLTPTQDWAVSAVFDQTFWGRGSFRLSLKGDRLDEVIDRVRVAGFDATGNIGKGKKANFNANLNLPLDRLHVPGGRLVLDGQFRFLSQVTDPFTGETRRVSRDSPYSLMAQFSQDLTQWRTTYGFSYSKMAPSVSYRRDGRDLTRNDPQISAYINYNPSSKTSWRLEARNITASQLMSIREVHSGQRDITPLTYAETRLSDTARTIRLTLRRSL
ncbi:MAG: hypothetical protein JWM33_2996 [Caulobacteraceae bacterium]|nr:hypothetical protein [Caulobacteraceae bacterium]